MDESTPPSTQWPTEELSPLRELVAAVAQLSAAVELLAESIAEQLDE